MRQVNGWGFQRMDARSRGSGSKVKSIYYHELFVRHMPDLVHRMSRQSQSVSAASEYAMSIAHPYYSPHSSGPYFPNHHVQRAAVPNPYMNNGAPSDPRATAYYSSCYPQSQSPIPIAPQIFRSVLPQVSWNQQQVAYYTAPNEGMNRRTILPQTSMNGALYVPCPYPEQQLLWQPSPYRTEVAPHLQHISQPAYQPQL